MAEPPKKGLEESLPFIWRELTDMCDAPITVWIDCMWQPLGIMAMEYFMLDLWQILTSFARPNIWIGTTRLGRHGKRAKKGRKGRFRRVLDFILELDPNAFIGENLPGGARGEGAPVSLARARAWLIFGVIERVTFWWFVFELVTEFLYRWMSAVQETKYCQARDNAVFFSHNFSGVAIGILGWSPQHLGSPLKFRRITFYNGFGIRQDTAAGIAWFQTTFKARTTGQPGTIGIRARVIAGPNTGKEDRTIAATVSDEEVTMGATLDIGPGDTVVMECIASGPIYDLSKGFALVQCSP